MAFYNRKMAANKSLMKAWRAGHLRKLDGDEEIRLPEICGEIGNWMRRDRRPRSRLSLRSFSVLLSGAIRLYGNQVDQLLKETEEYILPYNCRDFGSNSTSGHNLDQMDSSPADDDNRSDEESTVFTSTPNNYQKSNAKQYKKKKRDQQVQTSPPEPHNLAGFDPNLPFGYVIIHDNYHSRIPSKILFSSLSENVKFLNITKPMN